MGPSLTWSLFNFEVKHVVAMAIENPLILGSGAPFPRIEIEIDENGTE